jgi:hypothetical protein
MTRKQPWLEPINITGETWLYAEGKGLCVVHVRPGATDTFYLPWRSVGNAMRLRQQMKAARSPALRRHRAATERVR